MDPPLGFELVYVTVCVTYIAKLTLILDLSTYCISKAKLGSTT